MNDNINLKIFNIIEKSTGISISSLNPSVDFKEQIDLDSIELVRLAKSIEDEFNIELPLSMIGVNTIDGFVNIIKNEINKKK